MRLHALALVAVAAALLFGGCGGDATTGLSGADPANGKELFQQGASGKQPCGSCHALADAGTAAQVGPDLDQAFGYACRQGFAHDTFYDVVLAQIELPARDGQMPANLVTGQDAVDVAAYVAGVAGKDIEGCETAAGGQTGTAPAQTGGTQTTGG